MSDNENFEQPENPKTKPKKTRKPITDERREALKIQLKAAREKSNAIRAKKALAKKIDKEEEQKKIDEKIALRVLGENTLDQEIKSLKEEIKNLKESGGTSKELKELKEELNLFKKGLKEQIENAKSNANLEPKKINVDNKEENQNVNIEPPKEELKAASPQLPKKTFKKVYCSRRGFIDVPI